MGYAAVDEGGRGRAIGVPFVPLSSSHLVPPRYASGLSGPAGLFAFTLAPHTGGMGENRRITRRLRCVLSGSPAVYARAFCSGYTISKNDESHRATPEVLLNRPSHRNRIMRGTVTMRRRERASERQIDISLRPFLPIVLHFRS